MLYLTVHLLTSISIVFFITLKLWTGGRENRYVITGVDIDTAVYSKPYNNFFSSNFRILAPLHQDGAPRKMAAGVAPAPLAPPATPPLGPMSIIHSIHALGTTI